MAACKNRLPQRELCAVVRVIYAEIDSQHDQQHGSCSRNKINHPLQEAPRLVLAAECCKSGSAD